MAMHTGHEMVARCTRQGTSAVRRSMATIGFVQSESILAASGSRDA